MWLSASVAENTLIVLDLEVVQVVYEPAALTYQEFLKLRQVSTGACLDVLVTAARSTFSKTTLLFHWK